MRPRIRDMAETTEPDTVISRKFLAETAPALVAVFAGMGIAYFADSNLLKLVAVAAAAAPLLLLRMGTLKRALLGIALLEVVFPIDVYVNNALDLGELGAIATLNPEHVNAVAGFNVSITSFCLIALYGIWIAEAIAGRSPKIGRYRPVIPAIVYFLAILASVGVAQSPSLAFYEIVLVVQALMLMVYVVHFVSTREEAWYLVWILLLGLALQSLLVIAQAGLGFSLDLGPIGTSSRGSRVAGTVGSPNSLGGYLALVASLALGTALSPTRSNMRYLGAAAFVLGTLSLYLTSSRGAWAGFVVSMLIMAVFTYQREWVSRRLLVTGVALFAAIVVGLLGSSIAERLSSGSTLGGRIDLIEIGISMIRDHPILGVGSNHFAASLGPYVTEDFSASWISTVHNKYILVWAETGLLALMAFLWLLISSLVRAWRTSIRCDRALAPVVVGLGAGIAANMVHMTVEIYHGRQQTQMLWIVIGLIIAISTLDRSHHREGPKQMGFALDTQSRPPH